MDKQYALNNRIEQISLCERNRLLPPDVVDGNSTCILYITRILSGIAYFKIQK